jgi:N6-L-threonylcarbamoyladenine synthase
MRILAIETSCDETSVAVLNFDQDGSFDLLSNIISSQVKIHAPFGGVVPMLANREHQKNLVPILEEALKESKIRNSKSEIRNKSQIQNSETLNLKLKNLKTILNREPELLKQLIPFLEKYQKPDIDYIAVTNGPGLEPALWVGINFTKALAYFWDLPVIPINHIEGHIIANWLPIGEISKSQFPISKNSKSLPTSLCKRKGHPPLSKEGWGGFADDLQFATRDLLFPAVCLVVSGGHTQLILMKNFGQYEILGETRDDAAGEAFDKLAKMLGLGYPGGPIVSQMSSSKSPSLSLRLSESNDPTSPKGGELLPFRGGWEGFSSAIKFPRPMINSGDFDFSFSGLKTAALYLIKTLSKEEIKELTPAICAEFQQAAVDVLVSKTISAAKQFNAKNVILAGGVAANDALRENLKIETCNLKLNFFVPPKEFCGDNAAMIALTAALKSEKISWNELQVDSNLRIS